MKTRIVKIGNSQGVRIPRPLLEQAGIRGEVEIEAENGALVIRQRHRPREGWAATFQKAAQTGDDDLLDEMPISLSKWDEEEWEWR